MANALLEQILTEKDIHAVIINEQYGRPHLTGFKTKQKQQQYGYRGKVNCSGGKRMGPWFHLSEMQPICFDELLFNTERFGAKHVK